MQLWQRQWGVWLAAPDVSNSLSSRSMSYTDQPTPVVTGSATIINEPAQLQQANSDGTTRNLSVVNQYP